MNPKSLPFLPLHFFYFPFSKPQKRIFLVAWLGTMAAGLIFLVHFLYPDLYISPIQTVGTISQETVAVDTVSSQYRSLPLSFSAFRQWIGYTAGPIQPATTSFGFFAILLIIGWSTFLTALTQVKSRWVWVGFLVYALFIHFSEIALLVYPGDSLHILEFCAIILPLGLSYAWQSELLKTSIGVRFIIFFGIMALLFGNIAFSESSLLTYQKLFANSSKFFPFVSVGFLFFIAKEPTNLIVFLGTNRQFARHRLDFRIIFSLLLLLLLVEAIWLNEYMNFGLLGGYTLNIRPSFLIFIAAIFTAFTSQNHMHQVKGIFGDHFTFSLILLAWSILTLAFLGTGYAQGDVIFSYTYERIAVICFAGIGLGHTFFIMLNHKDLLARKINLFYLMTQGPRFGFQIVWLIGLCALVFAEGSEGWKTINLAYHSRACTEGDIAWQKGDMKRTDLAFRQAIAAAPVSPKANYNLAAIKLTDPELVAEAFELYRQAEEQFSMPKATINAANLLWYNNQPEEAIRILKTGAAEQADGRLFNNLALMYQIQDQADSAILALKKAVEVQPKLAAPFSNLSLLYLDNDRPIWSDSMMVLAGQSPAIPTTVRANQYFLALRNGTSLDGMTPPSEQADAFTRYNYILAQLREGKLPDDKSTLKSLADQTQLSDALLLDGHILFAQDSISYAISRLKFLAAQYPNQAGKAYRTLGLNFFEREVPEMARYYFQQAGDAKDSLALLWAANMLTDMGQAEAASLEMSSLRAENPKLWDGAAKELAMLLTAYGQGVYAATEWDLSTLDFEERMRISRYADSIQFYIPALENYRQIIASDSTTVLPYLEMGRLYAKYGDTLALVNLELGLEKAPENSTLQIAYADALLEAGQTDKANSLFANINATSTDSINYLLLAAHLALAQQDTTMALANFKGAHQFAPLHVETLLSWTDLLWEMEDYAQGHALLSEALEFNDQNPELWLAYAQFSLGYGLADDAAFGLDMAQYLSPDESQKAAYLKLYQAWEASITLP